MKFKFLFLTLLISANTFAQIKSPISISGTISAGYEGYSLTKNPSTWTGYTQRRPWNQFRFNIAPTIKIGKFFSMPLNFNFTTKPTNFAGPYAGLGSVKSYKDFLNFISNPGNSFGANPKYKDYELQLGTQYLNYSNLSTGDIGVFGIGFDLHPKDYIFKFFTGVSQQAINYVAPTLLPNPTPGLTGAYRRSNWMMQIGKEEEGKYKVALSFSKGKDRNSSLTPLLPPTVNPQEGFTTTFLTNVKFNKGWYLNSEIAQAYYTRNTFDPNWLAMKSFAPFLESKISTQRDYAADLSVGKKMQNYEVGVSSKYIGAGFITPGFPYMQPDKLDYTVNTKFNAWKNKMNIVASAGQRINNVSTATPSKQFLGNLNWFTQFNDRFSLNATYNNFGFTAPSGSAFSIKNVSNDYGINPSYNWSNSKMMHMLSLSYNYSKYDERDVFTNITTSNNTHTALLSYIPIIYNKKLTTDFSIMYFNNTIPVPFIKTTLLSFNAGAAYPLHKNKGNIKAQVQYILASNNIASGNNNVLASVNVDYKVMPKLTWTTFLSTNRLQYERAYTPTGANYLESQYRTGLKYRFGK
jgi:hypothetical protein